MPVPGPRTQHGPLPGYTNPPLGPSPDPRKRSYAGVETPTRINRWFRPIPIAEMGRTPGLMHITRRGNVLGAGQIRVMWRQAVNYFAAQAPYSWTSSAPNPDEPGRSYPALGITRALRYMTRSVYAGSGIDNTRFHGLHTAIKPRVRSKPVTLGAGQVRTRPTVRNRITSFGSRIQPINQQVVGAYQEDTNNG